MRGKNLRSGLGVLLALAILLGLLSSVCALAEGEEPYSEYQSQYSLQLIERAGAIYKDIVKEYGSIESYADSFNSIRSGLLDRAQKLYDVYVAYNSSIGQVVDFVDFLVDLGVSVPFKQAGGVIAEHMLELIGDVVFDEASEYFGLTMPPTNPGEFVYYQAERAKAHYNTNTIVPLMYRARANDGRFTSAQDAARFLREYIRLKNGKRTLELASAYYNSRMQDTGVDFFAHAVKEAGIALAMNVLLPKGNFAMEYLIGLMAESIPSGLDLVISMYDDEDINAWWADMKDYCDEAAELFRYDEENLSYPPQHDIFLNPTGGNVIEPIMKVYEGWAYGYSRGCLPKPWRRCYRFLGWFDEEEGGQQIHSDDLYLRHEDQQLFAHWVLDIADQGSCGDDLTYTLYGDGTLVIEGTGRMTSAPWQTGEGSPSTYVGDIPPICVVRLPEGLTSIEGPTLDDPWNGIGAFRNCMYLIEVVIPDSVTDIGDYAFADSGLRQVRLPAGLVNLGRNAFENCGGIQEITLPDGTKWIGQNALAGTSISELTLPDSLENVSAEVLKGTKVRELTLPAGLTWANGVLTGSVVETLILAPGTQRVYDYVASDANYLREVRIPDSVTEIGEYAFNSCDRLGGIELPPALAVIGRGAFMDCPLLRAIDLPDSVRTIGGAAFARTGLKALTLPEGVEVLGGSFLAGTEVTSLTVPASIQGSTEISGEGVLEDSSVAQLRFAPGAKVVPDHMGYRAACLTQVTLSDSIERIGYGAFYQCTGLSEIALPAALVEIGESAFYGCAGIRELALPEGLRVLGEDFLEGTSVTSLTIPASIQEMNGVDGVRSVTFAPGLTRLPENACRWSRALVDVFLPESVTELGDEAFRECSALERIDLPSALTRIGLRCFSQCSSLSSLTLPASIREIGTRCFEGCGSLKALTIPADVTVLYGDEYPTEGPLCESGVEQLTFAPGVTRVPNLFAYGAGELRQVTLSDTVQRIGDSAFSRCGKLAQINLPDSLTRIGQFAFYGTALADRISMNRHLVEWTGALPVDEELALSVRCISATDNRVYTSGSTDESVLYAEYSSSDGGILWARGLRVGAAEFRVEFTDGSSSDACLFIVHDTAPLVLPAALTAIGEEAFMGCAAKEIVLPPTVTEIGPRAFANCGALGLIHLPDSVTDIDGSAFDGAGQVIFVCQSENAGAAFARARDIPCYILP